MMLAEQDEFETKRRSRLLKAIYVYEAPLRLWHWVNALAVTVLAVTGYLIGTPLPGIGGEASDYYMMGWLRVIHFSFAWIFAFGFVGRIYWAFVGNRHARQIFLLPLMSAKWWGEVWHELKWYMFITREPFKYVGHNPMAQLMMFLFFTIGAMYMICTGCALYGEALGIDSWAYQSFSWVFTAVGGNSLQVHNWHRMGLWVTIIFVMFHVYAVFREDIMSRQSLISTMVSGWRMFKD
jgi:Ni/Fe-hydrogenase 1 B-type cytochrome subunit